MEILIWFHPTEIIMWEILFRKCVLSIKYLSFLVSGEICYDVTHVEISDHNVPLQVPYNDLLDILFTSSSIQYLGIPVTSETPVQTVSLSTYEIH